MSWAASVEVPSLATARRAVSQSTAPVFLVGRMRGSLASLRIQGYQEEDDVEPDLLPTRARRHQSDLPDALAGQAGGP